MAETQVSPVRSRPRWAILRDMKIKVGDLKRVIREAVADHMRLPRGPNSRDDAENRPLSNPAKDRINIEEDPTYPNGSV